MCLNFHFTPFFDCCWILLTSDSEIFIQNIFSSLHFWFNDFLIKLLLFQWQQLQQSEATPSVPKDRQQWDCDLQCISQTHRDTRAICYHKTSQGPTGPWWVCWVCQPAWPGLQEVIEEGFRVLPDGGGGVWTGQVDPCQLHVHDGHLQQQGECDLSWRCGEDCQGGEPSCCPWGGWCQAFSQCCRYSRQEKTFSVQPYEPMTLYRHQMNILALKCKIWEFDLEIWAEQEPSLTIVFLYYNIFVFLHYLTKWGTCCVYYSLKVLVMVLTTPTAGSPSSSTSTNSSTSSLRQRREWTEWPFLTTGSMSASTSLLPQVMVSGVLTWSSWGGFMTR